MNDTPAHIASEVAAHKAKNFQQAVEVARELQQEELVKRTAQETKDALLAGLKEVFGEGDEKNPQQMTVLIRRIPLLCTNVQQMHEDIAVIKSNQTQTSSDIASIKSYASWGIKIIITAVLAAVLKLVLVP